MFPMEFINRLAMLALSYIETFRSTPGGVILGCKAVGDKVNDTIQRSTDTV